MIARQGAHEPFEISSTVIVSADGRHSLLVRQRGITRPRSWLRPRHFGLKRHLNFSDRQFMPEGSVGLYLLTGGYVGACRVEGELTNVCGLLPETRLRRHRGDLDRLADDAFSANAVFNELWRNGRPIDAWKAVSRVRVEVSTPTLPGILYVGDAKGTIDPLGGQGMTMALLGAEMLAPFVARASSQKEPSVPPSAATTTRPGTDGSTGESRSAGPFTTSCSTPGRSISPRPSKRSRHACWLSASTRPAILQRCRSCFGVRNSAIKL